MPYIHIDAKEIFGELDDEDIMEELLRRDITVPQYEEYARLMQQEFAGKNPPKVVSDFVYEVTGQII